MATNDNLRNNFLIVGIGASAGGLDAFQRFLAVLPQDFGFALVFIQHLSAKHKSLLHELLSARRPSLVIQQITDGLKIQPGRLYLAPPGREVRLRNGLFQTTVHPEGLIHLPIDEFLSSLAEDAGERSIAAIFSGAGTDGARGCRAVRSAGGTVFVQDPQTADFDSMPLAAIATGQADAVLSPEDIATELLKLQGPGAAVSHEFPIMPEEYDDFFRLLREKTGSRFNHYKKNVVSRRIRRRMYLHGLSAVNQYLDLISNNDSEAVLLASDLMIGVTSFFRDRVAWKALNLEAVRKIAAENTNLPVRVWTPASATGEEAYSIAMMLMQELALAGKKRDIQVFATDMNDRALERAREGKYPASIIADVPQEYVQKYFTSTDDGNVLVINKDVRESVVFARQDLLSDPPFSKLDLIICRNFMIYLEPEAQEKCIKLFHYALNNGGYLFLGNAETVGKKSELFKSIGHKQCRVYRKLETGAASRLPISVPYATERQASLAKKAQITEQSRSNIEIIQEKLLEDYGPASVAVDQNYEIVYHNGPTNKYLRQPRGVPTRNLLELLPENLRTRIRGAIYRSGREDRPVVIRTSVAGDDNKKRHIILRITKNAENLFIVVFQEKSAPSKEEAAEQADAAVIEETAIHQLESELSATRADLQTHIEQLKSLNEELQSSNEEMQAANEELETSREELQSLNEELITVNSQLQGKIEEQDATNNDLNNFLSSTNIPTIFLDLQFKVKRFTPAMLRLIKLLPSDVGRPIIDMSQENLGPDLTSDAQRVLETLLPARQERELGGACYVRTTLPYRTADNRIEGVVVTYNDVTELKRAEERTQHLASFPQLNPNPVVEVDSSGKVIFANPGTERILESLGLDKREVQVFLPKDIDVILKDIEMNSDFSVSREVLVKNRIFGETIHLIPQFNVARIYAYDITERKMAEEALQESEQRVRLKLNSILSPEGDIGALELGDIIDAPAIQSLMDRFYDLTRVPLAVIDLKGKVLVGVGWQEICTKFHRVHPETCGYCIESDTLLTEGVPAGEYKLYKCKNNMWDVATPIEVGGKNLGHFFTGQFLFDDEAPDYEFFRAQANQYGFDQQEYLSALDKVPRLSRATVDAVMGFFMKLSGMISQLSYSNIKLARSLAERDALMDSLRKSQQQNEFLADIVRYADQPFGQGFPDGRLGLINKAFEQLTGYSEDELRSMDWARVLTPPEWQKSENQKLEELHRTGKPVRYEKECIRKEGKRVPIELLVHLVTDPEGKPLYYYSFLMDITERKLAEEAVQTTLRRFYTVLSSMYTGLLLVTDDGRVEFANQAFCDYFYLNDAPADLVGLTSADLTAKINNAYLHPDEAVARIREIVDRGQPVKGEEVAMRDGFELLRDFIPIQVKGESHGRLWYHTDITERKRAEEALRVSEEKYRSLFDNMIDGFAYHRIVLDEAGKPVDYIFLEVNDAFERLTGLKRGEIAGRRVREVLPGIENDPADWIGAYGQVALTGREARFEQYAAPLGKWYSVTAYSPRKEHFVTIFEDITARRQADDALRESEERFRKMFERHRATMLLIEPETGAIVDANASAADFYGRSIEALRSLTIQDINQLSPDDVAAERNNAKEEQRNYFVFPHKLADGRVRWVEVYSSPITVRGKPLLFSVIHDITERRQAEEALRQLNRTLQAHTHSDRALLRATEEALYLQEICRIIVEDCGYAMVWVGFAEHDEARSVRPAASAGFEAGYLDTLQLTSDDTERGRGPTGTAIRTGRVAMCRNMQTDPQFEPWRAEAIKRGYASSAAFPLLADGRAFGALTIYSREPEGFSDDEVKLLTELAGDFAYSITTLRLRAAHTAAENALRESEERYRSLFESMLHGFARCRMLYDESGRPMDFIYLDVNSAFGKITGLKNVVGRKVTEVIPGIRDAQPEVFDICGRVALTGHPEKLESEFKPLGLWLSISIYSTELEYFVAIFDDITERKKAEASVLALSEDMAARNLELEFLNRELESFVYSVSHDLRAPIRTMSGFAKIIIEDYAGKLDAQGRDYINRILKGSEKSTQLINDLLRLSQISRQDMDRMDYDLSGIVSSIETNLRESNPGRSAEITIAEGLRASVDPNLIRIALTNLIENAWKFTSKNTNARIEFGALQKDGKTVYSVRDNGAGFNQTYADKMFLPFQRLHMEKEFEGTGIGLAIVERVIRRHGGAIWAEGEVGKGATVFFTLG